MLFRTRVPLFPYEGIGVRPLSVFFFFFFFVVLLIPIIYYQLPLVAPNPDNAAECVDATADELTFCTINYMTTESTAGKEEKYQGWGGAGRVGCKLGINGDRVSTLVGLVDLPANYRHLELFTHHFPLLRVDQPETFNGTLFSDPSFEDRDNAAANLASTCTFAVYPNVLER